MMTNYAHKDQDSKPLAVRLRAAREARAARC